MPDRHEPWTILMADDDEDDRHMTLEALQSRGLTTPMRFVSDGQELLDYLRRDGPYRDPVTSPRPAAVLLDLNMPRMSGREALAAIKADKRLRSLPVTVLTTSGTTADIASTYDLGANSFITKPASYADLADTMAAWHHYWFAVAEVPPLLPPQ